MQQNKPGAQKNSEQASYNPTARNFDQQDVAGSSQPINEINQSKIGQENQGVDATEPNKKEANKQNTLSETPEETGREGLNRNEDSPNAPSE